jgi:hypothetical protein
LTFKSDVSEITDKKHLYITRVYYHNCQEIDEVKFKILENSKNAAFNDISRMEFIQLCQ